LGSLAYGVDGDIFVADWDGSNPVRIADGRPAANCGGLGEYWGEGPIWSPDGRYLAYRHANCQASPDAWWDVVISDPQGNVVASFPSQGWRISWSPDSTRVAVWVDWENGRIGIYSVQGVRTALLTVPPGMLASGDNDPEWFPDGKSLVVPNAVEIPLDGSPARPLPWNGFTTFSPDGSRVAYNTRGSLVVAEADGSNPQEMFGDGAGRPIWSSAGDRIAFTSASAQQLHVVDVATGTLTLVAHAETESEVLGVLDFSPQGDEILFSRLEPAVVSSLWSVHTDGSDPRQLLAGVGWADWQPESSKT
jgi:Tol biopolymer transport system component